MRPICVHADHLKPRLQRSAGRTGRGSNAELRTGKKYLAHRDAAGYGRAERVPRFGGNALGGNDLRSRSHALRG